MQSRTDRRVTEWRHHRRKRGFVIAIAAIVVLFAVVFLPGPNGLAALFSRTLRLRRLQSELPRLQARIDSLEQVCRYLADPVCATEYAAQRMARRLGSPAEVLPTPGSSVDLRRQ